MFFFKYLCLIVHPKFFSLRRFVAIELCYLELLLLGVCLISSLAKTLAYTIYREIW